MKMFYPRFIESVFTFLFVCWFGFLSLKNKNRLFNLVKVCGEVAGVTLENPNLEESLFYFGWSDF